LPRRRSARRRQRRHDLGAAGLVPGRQLDRVTQRLFRLVDGEARIVGRDLTTRRPALENRPNGNSSVTRSVGRSPWALSVPTISACAASSACRAAAEAAVATARSAPYRRRCARPRPCPGRRRPGRAQGRPSRPRSRSSQVHDRAAPHTDRRRYQLMWRPRQKGTTPRDSAGFSALPQLRHIRAVSPRCSRATDESNRNGAFRD